MANELAKKEDNIFQIFDQLDDQQIIDEIKGQVLESYVYSFQQAGREITGMSKAGVDAACAELAKKGYVLREMEVQVHRDQEAYEVIVKVGKYAVKPTGQEVLLETAHGCKRQAKKHNGRINPFAFEQSVVKAARNAKRRLIPETLIVEIIKAAKEQGRVQQVERPHVNTASLPSVQESFVEEPQNDLRQIIEDELTRLCDADPNLIQDVTEMCSEWRLKSGQLNMKGVKLISMLKYEVREGKDQSQAQVFYSKIKRFDRETIQEQVNEWKKI